MENDEPLSPSIMNPLDSLIPEVADFEHQKENILPLKQGRKASILSDLFKSNPSSRLDQLHSQRQSYESKINCLGPSALDPLDVYHTYVKWIQQHYPEGQSSESGLTSLLERALSGFREDSRYKNDPRYLGLWMTYAKLTEEPIEIFKFLSVNEIGLNLATYYEEYACFLEEFNR